LSQIDKIETGKKTLILADEIESVTEPGVAGKIISATCEFFVHKGCFLVVATHLGQEISKNIPPNSRIDGIEAKGLDEYFELIVDHNPVLGKLASSTPELIIEKLASSKKTDYYRFLHDKVKKK
jgi:DNA mismatch repair protein MutS2